MSKLSTMGFRFTIHLPIRTPDSPYLTQRCTISSTAPVIVYPFELARDVPIAVALDLAKAELKMAMINAILNGDWEVEKS